MAESGLTTEGARVWLTDGKPDDWKPAIVTQCDGVEVVFKTDYGEECRMWISELDGSKVKLMNSILQEGIADMAKMSELNQASILCNLNTRYQNNDIYTYIGSILISVNPYKRIQHLYSDDTLQSYTGKDLGEKPPHVFAIANECFTCMWKREESQCVLISGESGAGKTEATKFMLAFLSKTSQQSCGGETVQVNGRSIDQSILESGPLLEALGNAKTVYNNNSSRFGKFIQLLFCKTGQIKGGRITDYLLEKHRVVRQNPGERNYHIFYQLMEGLPPKDRVKLFLTEAKDFHYLNQSGCISDPTLHDAEDWDALEKALGTIGFKEGQQTDMRSVLAGILQLGNVQFVNAGGAQVVDTGIVERTSQLLGLDCERLEAVMKEKTMKLRGEYITSPQSIEQACGSRDSISMALYSQLFRWIIAKINQRIKGPDNFHFIGILDIFGFENFEVNRFEQFCINFANEKLQEFFNRHIFSLEQIEYDREGIDWCEVEWSDNSECLDLVEKNLGLMSLINEESRFPKGTDNSLLQKLHNQHAKNQFYVKPRVTGSQFGIKHYAGEVFYNINGFLEKNRDTFRDDLLGLLKDSSCDLIYDMFEKIRGNSEDSGKGRSKQAPTASGQFKKSLHSLMEKLSSANPFFVRCIKPNMKKVQEDFNAGVVLNQLRYSGMLETVRVRKAGFPVRRIYSDFVSRYRVIALTSNPDPIEVSRAILSQIDVDGVLWKLGKTKAFLKEMLEQKLEKLRVEKVNEAAIIVQSVVRACWKRKYFLRIKAISIHAQRFIRGFLAKTRYRRMRVAIITFQRFERGRRARVIFNALLGEKRRKEKKRRDAVIMIQKYARGFLARKMFKVLLEKHRQLKALKEQMERERKQREEQARLERERKAREKEELVKARKQAEMERQERDRLARDVAQQEQCPPNIRESRASSIGSQSSALAHLDAAIDQAAMDNSYAVVNKRNHSHVNKEQAVDLEHEELERIMRLEHEIANLHRRSEALASVASETRQSLLIEEFNPQEDEHVFEEYTKTNQNGNTESLHDLGFNDLKDQINTMVEIPYEHSSDHASPIDNVGGSDEHLLELQEIGTAPSLSDMEDESYFTDSTFDDDDISDTLDVGERWNPDVYFHSYLDMKSGLMHQWKRRWCVINNSTFMFFRSKQDSLKSGWLFKKAESGKGTLRGTIGRKLWQKKWFSLRSQDLKFYESDDENAKHKGTIELCSISDVTDVTEKENGIDIIMTSTKVHHLAAETTEEANEWYSILMKMLSSTERERESMESEFANPNNALGTFEGQSIIEVNATTLSGRSNTFSISTSQRVYSMASDTQEEMHHWITLLNESKESTSSSSEQGHTTSVQQGWLMKTTYERQKVSHQKRWFVLKQNVIEYYKNSDRSAQKLGTMGLNSLCLVSSPDDAVYRQTGLWQIVVYGRKHSLILSTEVEEEANIWSSEIQAMIDSQQPIMTKTKALLEKLKNAESEKEIDLIYKKNPILRQTNEPLRSPLLPLPYQQQELSTIVPFLLDMILVPVERISSSEGRVTLRDEAVRIFKLLLSIEDETFASVEEEAKVLQEILKVCHGSNAFHDELYLQLIRQTAVYTIQLTTEGQMGTQQHATACPHYWHLIACMCSAYHPSRPVLIYLKTHLKRVQEKYPKTFAAAYARFAESALNQQTSRRRENVPSITEICSVLEMRDLVTTIYCYGGATCNININSATSAGKVVEKLQQGMQLQGNRNTFALFERKESTERALEPNAYIADVVAKFEISFGELPHERCHTFFNMIVDGIRLNEELRSSSDYGGAAAEWGLYFKLYCIFDPFTVSENSVEYHFVFEDVHEQVIQGLYPASEDLLRQLSALRLQFVKGNYSVKSWSAEIEKFYPINKVKSAYELTNGVEGGLEKSLGSISVTVPESNTISKKKSGAGLFNTFRKRGLKKVKEEDGDEDMKRTLYIQELQEVISNVSERWRKLKGMNEQDAVFEYVRLARTWPGYGSHLFEVENHEAQFGDPLLTLAVSAEGSTVYKRGHVAEFEHFPFQSILSFGAASATVFRLQTDSRGDISFHSEQVNEIVKLMRAYVQSFYKSRPMMS